MTKYIPLEEVKKYTIKIDELLKNISDLTFKPKAIGLIFSKEWMSSIKGTINVNVGTIGRYLCRIEDIQTIDPIATIDEMIEERDNLLMKTNKDTEIIKTGLEIHFLEELKSRLSLTK